MIREGLTFLGTRPIAHVVWRDARLSQGPLDDDHLLDGARVVRVSFRRLVLGHLGVDDGRRALERPQVDYRPLKRRSRRRRLDLGQLDLWLVRLLRRIFSLDRDVPAGNTDEWI